MKKQADEHRSKRQFQIGDLVFVKLQPYVQSSLAQRSNQKLAFKFFGPYRFLAHVGAVAYRLELPASSSVYLVFHVSQLKKSVGTSHSVTSDPPSEAVLWSVQEWILRTRSITKGTCSVTQGLLLWSNLPRSLAMRTWSFFANSFPAPPSGTGSARKGGGMLRLNWRLWRVRHRMLKMGWSRMLRTDWSRRRRMGHSCEGPAGPGLLTGVSRATNGPRREAHRYTYSLRTCKESRLGQYLAYQGVIN